MFLFWIKIVPFNGSKYPVNVFNKVDLPMPLSPIKPTNAPASNFAFKPVKTEFVFRLILYPISNYMSKEYRDAGKDNTVRTFALASVPMLSIPILLLLFGKISLFIALWAMFEMIILGLLYDAIHDSFHLHKSLWKKLPGYKRWGKYHYLHHVDLNTNYGIFSFHWDKIFKTLKKK